MEGKACTRYHINVDTLVCKVNKEWAAKPVAYIRSVCQAFRPRLERIIDAGENIMK